MKDTFIHIVFVFSMLIPSVLVSQGVAINDNGTAPDPSAMLDVQSTEKGFLPPRMTSIERSNIAAPAEGLVVYDTDEHSLFLYSSGVWERLAKGSGSPWLENGASIYYNNGNVGIGTDNPQFPLHLLGGLGTSWQVERLGGAQLRGTANINEASVGTHNATGFRLLTNNTVRMHVSPTGNIGIGSVNPTARLHLIGDLRIQDGTHGAGKVLTSDALGNASWSKVNIYGDNTIVVDAAGSGDFLTISAALNSVSPTAENPVTILIKPGTYFEEVVLKSHVRLVGEDENNVMITGWADAMPGLNGYVYGMLLNTVTDVLVRNLTIRSNSSSDPYLEFGVWMIGSEARFENVHIKGDFASFLMLYRGIKAENSTVEFINGSILDTDTRSIELLNSEARVINSKLSSSTIHIEVENGSHLELANTLLSGGGEGVNIKNGGSAKLIGNQFENNWIGVNNYGRLLMSGNHIRSTASAGVSNNSNATITGNYFIDCISRAISDFSPAGRTTITGNHIENSSHEGQPALTANSDAVISSNVFHNNTHGDIVVGSNTPWLIGNRGTVSGNPVRGIMAGIGDMRIEREGNNMLLNLTGDGKVGVGTLNPRGRFNISLNSGVTNASTIDEYPLMISYPSNATGQETGIAFRISVQQNPDQTPGAAITHLRSGAGSVGHLLFKTKESGDTGPLAERMRITSTGNVGIGTSEPSAPLHVQNGTGSVQLSTNLAGVPARITLNDTSNEDSYIEKLDQGKLRFRVGGTSTRMTITPEGNVGIGTQSPAALLQISGSGRSLEINPNMIRSTDGNLMTIRGDDELLIQSMNNMELDIASSLSVNSGLSANITAGTSIFLTAASQIRFNNMLNVIGSSGVGVNTTNTAGFTFAVNGTAAKPGGGSWAVFSDSRMKQDIEPIETGILDQFLMLRGYTFEYEAEAIKNRLALPGRQTGLLAQEVQQVFPDWVEANYEGYLFVTERGLTAIIVEALRELRAEKDAEIESLKNRLTTLEALLNLQ